jgi:hypothetical protein
MGASIYLPSVADIGAIFTEECTALGATEIDTYEDDRRLFQRAVITGAEDVRPGDPIRGGVAIRATGPRIDVHPFMWRQVCTNGAIMMRTVDTIRVTRVELETEWTAAAVADDVVEELRRAIQACGNPRYVAQSTEAMRGAAEMQADAMLWILPQLIRMSGVEREHYVSMVLDRFAEGRDRSVYALVNAVTSVARDTKDPEVRWQLESVGGRLLEMAPALASGDNIASRELASTFA